MKRRQIRLEKERFGWEIETFLIDHDFDKVGSVNEKSPTKVDMFYCASIYGNENVIIWIRV